MIYLVITEDLVSYHESAKNAALAAGFPLWDCAQPSNKIRTLEVGDEWQIKKDSISIVCLSGKVIS
jgi:hypothetical protein